jgi:hypothetical protein
VYILCVAAVCCSFLCYSVVQTLLTIPPPPVQLHQSTLTGSYKSLVISTFTQGAIMGLTGRTPHEFSNFGYASLARPVVTLRQAPSIISRTKLGRCLLLLVIFVWPVFYLAHGPIPGRIDSLREKSWAIPSSGMVADRSTRHPIEDLVLTAQIRFSRLLDSQSRSLEDAETEYRRRYHREPPPGFDKWFSYAQSKQSVLIDDFDMINDDLKLFWQMSPQRLVENIHHAAGAKHLSLPKCGFKNGTYHSQGGGWLEQDLGGKLLQEISPHMPDIDFLLNLFDEPRVVTTENALSTGALPNPIFEDESRTSTWSRVTRSCHNVNSTTRKPMVHDHGIPFVQDWYAAKDICQHPEFEHLYGLFSSPATALLTDAPIPILSQAAPTTFNDIVYPSPWYAAMDDQGIYDETEDPQWEDKLDTLYWAGRTTGSHSVNGSWKTSHRQRFVEFVHTLNQTKHVYLKQTTPGAWDSYEAVEDHSHLFDVKFTDILQCDEPDCTAQRSFFHPSSHEPPSRQFRSRFVFDIDGNSFSGRYYTLLRSRSVVLKQTIMKEWHDERLIPWVHFVPVSLGMQEVPEIMRFFTEDEEGRRRARDIAERGKEWHGRALRRQDATVYLYRLMLELARVMGPEREVDGRRER